MDQIVGDFCLKKNICDVKNYGAARTLIMHSGYIIFHLPTLPGRNELTNLRGDIVVIRFHWQSCSVVRKFVQLQKYHSVGLGWSMARKRAAWECPLLLVSCRQGKLSAIPRNHANSSCPKLSDRLAGRVQTLGDPLLMATGIIPCCAVVHSTACALKFCLSLWGVW